jgi:hypothetical protein
MPVSKHRRKPGGKSVRHPGRARAPAFRLDYESSARRAFAEKYTVPFYAAHGADHFAAEMLDIDGRAIGQNEGFVRDGLD